MRRADRLFQLIQLLRTQRIVTADELARELEVSRRTVYRDIQDLMASGCAASTSWIRRGTSSPSGRRRDGSGHALAVATTRIGPSS